MCGIGFTFSVLALICFDPIASALRTITWRTKTTVKHCCIFLGFVMRVSAPPAKWVASLWSYRQTFSVS